MARPGVESALRGRRHCLGPRLRAVNRSESELFVQPAINLADGSPLSNENIIYPCTRCAELSERLLPRYEDVSARDLFPLHSGIGEVPTAKLLAG